jgi:predicted permease
LTRSFVRRGLVLAQVALTVVLLFGASLFTHSLQNLKTINLGFDTDRVFTAAIHQRDLGGGGKSDNKAFALLLRQILERVRRLSNVDEAAVANHAVLTAIMTSGLVRATHSSGETTALQNVHFLGVGPGYFSALGIPLLRGRDFDATDEGRSPTVVVVNESLASSLWPAENPVGKRVQVMGWRNVEVIGVCGNTNYQDVREERKSIAYLSFGQWTHASGRLAVGTLHVRFRGQARQVERDVGRIVASVEPGWEVSNPATMALLRDRLISQERLLAFLSSLFGALGTALALVGIYGLISYSVTRRTREIGIRVSVGAERKDVLWLFVREAVALLGGGLLIGLPLALGLARLLEGLLYEVSTSEPLDLSITVVLMVLGGLLAAYLPGRRATRVDPVQALRCD